MRSIIMGLALVAIAPSALAQAIDNLPAASRKAERKPEAISLDGKPLYLPDWPADMQARLNANIQATAYDFTLHPDDPVIMLWMGRRYGFASRFNDAIAVFTRGVEKYPNDPRFLRHRGHRYLNSRQLDKAAADFEKAAMLVAGKPDEDEISSVPGAKPSASGTFKFNLFYHMGVTYFAQGRFDKALAAFDETGKYINDDEARISLADWRYMTLRRMGRHADAKALVAAIPEGLPIKDNIAYYRRILMYKGVLKPDDVLSPQETDARQIATQGYGVGNWYLVEGDPAKARAVFERVTAGTEWGAFGFLAAEADLVRMKAGR